MIDSPPMFKNLFYTTKIATLKSKKKYKRKHGPSAQFFKPAKNRRRKHGLIARPTYQTKEKLEKT